MIDLALAAAGLAAVWIVRSIARAARRRRALASAGRLGLPAPAAAPSLPDPDAEECRARRAQISADGRPDPTGMPDCGTGDGARWDAARVGWVRYRDGRFLPWNPTPARSWNPGPPKRVLG